MTILGKSFNQELISMTDQFKEATKNNGLKQVVWGSDEFVKKIEQTEKVKEMQDRRNHYEDCVAIIKGM